MFLLEGVRQFPILGNLDERKVAQMLQVELFFPLVPSEILCTRFRLQLFRLKLQLLKTLEDTNLFF